LSAAWIDFRVDQADAGMLIDELQAEYMASPEFMQRTKLHFMAPGGCLVFQKQQTAVGIEPSSPADNWRAISESLYHRTRLGTGGKDLCGKDYSPRPLKTDKDLFGFLGGIEDFKDWCFYLAPGSVCAEPKACRLLSAVETDRVRSEFDSVRIESFAAFIQTGFRDFLLESRIRKAELFEFVSDLVNGFMLRTLKSADTKDLESGIRTSTSLDGMIREIIAQFSRQSDEKKYNKCIIHAIQFINRDLSKPLSLSIVAENIGISASYLSSLFYRETGKQFNDYVTGRRMEKAMELLRNTNCKVYEVSELVGIPSYRYFSRLFKDHAGVAPRDFK